MIAIRVVGRTLVAKATTAISIIGRTMIAIAPAITIIGASMLATAMIAREIVGRTMIAIAMIAITWRVSGGLRLIQMVPGSKFLHNTYLSFNVKKPDS